MNNLRVLVVEPNPLMSQAVALALQGMGIDKLVSAPTTDQAFEDFRSGPIDLIISDWSPDVDGIEFLSRVRNDEAKTNPFVPIIILSAYCETKYVQKAVGAGINDYIFKPFTVRFLYRRLNRVIEAPKFFVRSGAYFGPCRRHVAIGGHRNQNYKPPAYTGDERRVRAIDIDFEYVSGEPTFN